MHRGDPPKLKYRDLREKLERMKCDWLLFIAAAESRGDFEEAAAFQSQCEKIDSMIRCTRGNPDI